LHVLTAGRGIEAAINGEIFRIDPRFRIRLTADYESRVAHYLREHVQPGARCINAGANVGAYVLQLSRWSEPDGSIIAIEPNPGSAAVLRRHVVMNGLTTRVRIEVAALGRVRGRMRLFDPADGSGLGITYDQDASSVPPDVTAKSIDVSVTTLDALCTSAQPDWMIIDVEGAELEVLSGSVETIQRRGDQLSIVVELHPHLWDEGGLGAFQALLRQLGREPVGLTGQRDPLGEYGVVLLRPV
jgi:FkbM family methyltransferase